MACTAPNSMDVRTERFAASTRRDAVGRRRASAMSTTAAPRPSISTQCTGEGFPGAARKSRVPARSASGSVAP